MGKNGWVNEAKYAYSRKLQNKQKYNLMVNKPKRRKKPHWISFKMKMNSQNREADNNHKETPFSQYKSEVYRKRIF